CARYMMVRGNFDYW
nr:immunoglobulin heavy chain junction region [Mus musculus]MBK4195028.1 immunoglobulin heavy chain junction region [Mus musculus]